MIDIIVRVFSALLKIGMPIGLFFVLQRSKIGASWRYIRIGAATFIASQVFHVPFNMIVLPFLIKQLGLDSLMNAKGQDLWILALFLGLSAGVFEEVARYLVYRYWLTSQEYTWKNAVTLGAGHGGCESILVGIMSIVTLVQMIVLRDADLSKILPPDKIEQTQEQIDHYWSLSWYEALLPAVERIIAMSFHVSASVLVLQLFVRKNGLWLVAAITFHTAIDMFAVLGLVKKWNLVVIETVLAVTVIPLAFWIIARLRPANDSTAQQADFRPVPQQDSGESSVDDHSRISE